MMTASATAVVTNPETRLIVEDMRMPGSARSCRAGASVKLSPPSAGR
jgi:hypothetical protein